MIPRDHHDALGRQEDSILFHLLSEWSTLGMPSALCKPMPSFEVYLGHERGIRLTAYMRGLVGGAARPG